MKPVSKIKRVINIITEVSSGIMIFPFGIRFQKFAGALPPSDTIDPGALRTAGPASRNLVYLRCISPNSPGNPKTIRISTPANKDPKGARLKIIFITISLFNVKKAKVI